MDERTTHSRRRKAEGLAPNIQSLRAQPTIETHTGQTTQGHTKQKTTNKTTYAPRNCQVTRALLTCACLYTVPTPTCTHAPLTNTRPTYDIPLAHPVAITNPYEARHTIDTIARWKEDSDATPHGGTEALTAKSRRAQQDQWEKAYYIASTHKRERN